MSLLTASEEVAHWSKMARSASEYALGTLASSRTRQMSVTACSTFMSEATPDTNISDTVFITCQHLG